MRCWKAFSKEPQSPFDRMSLLQSITWYARRFQAMTPAEVSHRVQERWRQWTQPAFLKGLEEADPGRASVNSPRLPDKAAAKMELRVHLADEARRLQAGQWQLFGWREVEVGAPPCWHRDAVCGVVIAPEKPAHRLNHRHLPDGADARTIWEINRWAEMTRLAMHGWLNDDLPAIRTAQVWLEDWCERNPPGLGINWTSPLEAALRLINFTWFDAIVQEAVKGQGAETVRTAQALLVKRLVPVHAAWIWRYRSAGSSANNHLLGELSALVVATSRWPGLAKISCPADVAWDLLGKEVLHQFALDGGSKEQALHYHLFAFDLAWLAVMTVGCKAGDVHDRLQAAAVYFQSLAQGGETWEFGDNDDAQVLPVTLSRKNASQEWLDWLDGKEGVLRYWLGCGPQMARPPAHRVFSPSGMAVAAVNGWKVRLDASPLGFGALAAHGHGDALHASVWDDGEALLIDPGTGGYYGHKELRAELAAWTAHNGPQPVRGYQTPRRMGAFLWMQHHAAPSVKAGESSLEATFGHEGHSFQRSVSIQDGTVTVQDAEAGGQAFNVRLIFSPQCQVLPASPEDGADWVIRRGAKRWLLKAEVSGQREALTECRVSSAYGSIETASCLLLRSLTGRLAFSLVRKPQ